MNRVEHQANRLICAENSVLEPMGSVISEPVLATPVVVVGVTVVGAGAFTAAVAVNGDGSFAATAFTGVGGANANALSARGLVGARRALA